MLMNFIKVRDITTALGGVSWSGWLLKFIYFSGFQIHKKNLMVFYQQHKAAVLATPIYLISMNI